MNLPTISAYLKLAQLPEYRNVKRKGVIEQRKQPRYDLTHVAGYWEALERLKNYKGRLYFNFISTDKNEYRKKDGTTPEYYLQCTPAKSKTINFSGIRFQYSDDKEISFASGEPSDRQILKTGVINPMYDQCNDGFLFLFPEDMQTLEILIIESGRQRIDIHRKHLSLGGFDEALQQLRQQARKVDPL